MSNPRKLIAAWLLPLLVAASVVQPAVPVASAAPAGSAVTGGSVAPLRPAPLPDAHSPGLPALADAAAAELSARGDAPTRTGTAGRAHHPGEARNPDSSRARSLGVLHAAYAHHLRAVRGSAPLTLSQPPPTPSL